MINYILYVMIVSSYYMYIKSDNYKIIYLQTAYLLHYILYNNTILHYLVYIKDLGGL